MFIEVFNPYKKVLATLSEKSKTHFSRWYSQTCSWCHYGILKNLNPNLWANINHAKKLSAGSHITSGWHRLYLRSYFWWHWNCKQPRVEARNSMSYYRTYFPLSLKLHIQSWKYFHSMVLCGVASDNYIKKDVRVFGQVVYVPLSQT